MTKKNSQKKAVKGKTAKKTAKGSSKKSKLDGMTQTHGKEVKEDYEPTTLAQVWGDDGTGKYRTLDESQYQKYLDDLNRSDLQSHAHRIGLLPIDDTRMLKDRLLREFRGHVASYRKPRSSHQDQHISELSDTARKILSEGK